MIELGAGAGDQVSAGQMLLVVESDKASMDIPAPADGVLVRLVVSEGDSVSDDALLAVLSTSAAAPAQTLRQQPVQQRVYAAPAQAAPSWVRRVTIMGKTG